MQFGRRRVCSGFFWQHPAAKLAVDFGLYEEYDHGFHNWTEQRTSGCGEFQ